MMATTRRSVLTFIALMVVTLLSFTECARAQVIGDTLTVYPPPGGIECYDGDSCQYPDFDRDVRLQGIDAPETDGPCPVRAELAEAELERILRYGPQEIVITDIGKYDRLIVDISIGNLNASQYMLSRGLATRWPIREPSTLCDNHESHDYTLGQELSGDPGEGNSQRRDYLAGRSRE